MRNAGRKSEWIEASKSHPCPICEHDDWCTVKSNGEVAYCMRVESDKPRTKGGWIHRVNLPPQKPAKKPKRIEDVQALARKMYLHPKAAETRQIVAKRLGVSVESLELLRVGYGCDYNGREYSSWPSRNAAMKVVGVSRRYENGEKKTYPGTSNAGVFCRVDWEKTDGDLWIVEGGSDVAACLSNGIAAIGRPSNQGGSETIARMLSNWRGRVIVYGERDKKEVCPQSCGKSYCPACWPGLHGARHVAAELSRMTGRRVEVGMPQGKDVREDLTVRNGREQPSAPG